VRALAQLVALIVFVVGVLIPAPGNARETPTAPSAGEIAETRVDVHAGATELANVFCARDSPLAAGGGVGDDVARAEYNGVKGPVQQVSRTARDGTNAVRQTFPNGSVKDISRARVKEFVPSQHPKAPPGTLQKVKFDNALPGSKGYKRPPTAAELTELR